MNKNLTFALFCYFLSSLLCVEAVANPDADLVSSTVASGLPPSNFPWSAGGGMAANMAVSPSVSDDFVIRRKVDFDNHREGYYTDSQFQSDWQWGPLYSPNTTQIRTVDGKKVLANFFPKGTWGRGGGLNQWGIFENTSGDLTEIYWTFRIKYQADFDWALGAKLPGVGFGGVKTLASGGIGPGIGNKGSSLRLMQVAGGKLKLYVYHHGMGAKYGDDMGIGTFGQLKRGEWQELTVRVVANQNGKSNGIMQVWLDGVLVASVQNIEMKTSFSPQTIQAISIGTFMGGADKRFAPDRNQFMWMDDIHFWQYSSKYLASNPSVARGLKLHPASHRLYTPISGSSSSNASPTVSLTSPKSEGQFAVGSTVSLGASASDSDGKIAKVEFYQGNTLLGTDTSSPYSYTWAKMKAGEYHITARATDDKGAMTVSEVVKIQVGTNSSPTVSLTSPKSDGQFAVGSSVSLGASASDSDGKIAKVEFYNGNTLLGTDTSSPYSYTWGKMKAGEYNLTARATDNKGAMTVSEVVKIQVGSSSQTDKNESVSSKPGLGVGSGLLEGLVSFYEMNSNASGVLRDSHGSNHGKSTSIGHVNGFTEKGNRYDGSSSISRAPHSSSLALTSEFTLMADVYREGPGQASGSVIVGKTLSATWAEAEVYSIAITSDNKIRIRSHIGGLKEWVSRQTVPQGKWVRVIASYKSGEGYTLYLDTASPEKSGKMSGTLYKSTQGLTIGGSQAGNRRKVEGILDNVGIWNRQLSPAEAESLIRTKATYPDFAGGATYRVTVTEATDQEAEEAGSSTSIETEAGEKLVFFVEDEQQGAAEFDYWSVDDVPVSDQALFELDMPEKDVTLTKHFKTFEAPEVRIVLPDGESEFEALSSVHVGFEVEEGDGDLAKVELYDGEELVGELGDESTGLDLDNLSEGTHELVAKLTDTDGNTYLSDPVVLKAVSARSRDLPSVLLDYAIGPNPAVDRLNILFTNLDGVYDFQIHVVSMSGSVEKTLSIRPEGSRVTIDVSDLTNGVYLLQLSANGNPVTSKKFIKL